MRKLRTLIVDDEQLAREGLALALRDDPEIEIIGQCGDGESAVSAIRLQRPDLVFLDVQMPAANGFQVLEELPEGERPAVIFVTAYDRHAVGAFDMCAVDYLLKPFRDLRLKAAVQRAKERLQDSDLREVQKQLRDLTSLVRQMEIGKDPMVGAANRLVFKIDGEHLFVEPGDIRWLEAQGDFVRFRTDNQLRLVRESLQSVEKRLDPKIFIRVHRSFIVNAGNVKKITPSLSGDRVLLMSDGAKIPMSRTFRDKLKVLLPTQIG